MSNINFFHNFEIFKKHLNLTGSDKQYKRLDIVKLAKQKAENNNIINSYKINNFTFDD